MSTTPVSNESLHDRRIEETVPLVSPEELLAEYPLSAELGERVVRSRREVKAVLDREDPRLLVVVGPCSVHDPVAALDRQPTSIPACHLQHCIDPLQAR